MKQIEAARGAGGWAVHLRSEPVWAAYVLEGKRRWEGEVTLPLTIT
jgi:hypothetical protein